MAEARVIDRPVFDQELLGVVLLGDPRMTVILHDVSNISSQPSITRWLDRHLQQGDYVFVDAPWTFRPLDPSAHPATEPIAKRIQELGVRVFGRNPEGRPMSDLDAESLCLRARQQDIVRRCFNLPQDQRADLIEEWRRLEAKWHVNSNLKARMNGSLKAIHAQAFQEAEPEDPQNHEASVEAHVEAIRLFAERGRVFSIQPSQETQINQLSTHGVTVMVTVGNFEQDPLTSFEASFYERVVVPFEQNLVP